MKRHSRAGLALVEVLFALGILALAMMGLVSVILHTSRHNSVMRENLVAMRAAERQIEVMQNMTFADIFGFYTQITPTNNTVFDVPGLVPPTPGGKVGSVKFPTNAGGNLLQESATGALMGVGSAVPNMDLNGNGASSDTVDPSDKTATNPANAYDLLPVLIELDWQGVQGPRKLQYRHVFLRR